MSKNALAAISPEHTAREVVEEEKGNRIRAIMKLTTIYRLCVVFLVVCAGCVFLAAYPANMWAAESPSAGEIVDEPPTEIAVDFADPLDIVLLRLQVLDAEGRDHAIGRPVIRADRKRLSVKVDDLKPGAYTVEWGVVDSDGHLSKGTFSFSVLGLRKLTRTLSQKVRPLAEWGSRELGPPTGLAPGVKGALEGGLSLRRSA